MADDKTSPIGIFELLDVYKRQVYMEQVVEGLFAPVTETQHMAHPVKKFGSRTTRPYSRRQFPPPLQWKRGVVTQMCIRDRCIAKRFRF